MNKKGFNNFQNIKKIWNYKLEEEVQDLMRFSKNISIISIISKMKYVQELVKKNLDKKLGLIEN